MGEGNYRPDGAVTRQCDPFGRTRDDDLARLDAWQDFVATVRAATSRAWVSVERSWRNHHARVIARSGLHELTLHENSHGTIFISIWPRDDLAPGPNALARTALDRVAEAIFRRVAQTIELRIATSAWTSARWVPARAGGSRKAATPANDPPAERRLAPRRRHGQDLA